MRVAMADDASVNRGCALLDIMIGVARVPVQAARCLRLPVTASSPEIDNSRSIVTAGPAVQPGVPDNTQGSPDQRRQPERTDHLAHALGNGVAIPTGRRALSRFGRARAGVGPQVR